VKQSEFFSISTFATAQFGFRLCELLLAKGILTPAEASSIMIRTADDLRSATEDDHLKDTGETVARTFERMAAWLQGNPGEGL
jgi:hypothetical protein